MSANQLQKAEQPVRQIVYRTRGHLGGPIARLMSPSDLGQLIKPFVFLDHFNFDGQGRRMSGVGWHPHSGIATVTVVLEGSIQYAESTGKSGVLSPGSIEWMRAGNGVWHTGALETEVVRGFQLWIALPPELENAPNGSHYVMPEESPGDGRVRVVLGSHGQMKSPIDAPPMNYLVVTLKAGERWSYEPPKGHEVAWVAVHEGVLRTPSPVSRRGAGDLRAVRGADRFSRGRRYGVRARLRASPSPRARARRLLRSHEREGPAPGRGGDSPHRRPPPRGRQKELRASRVRRGPREPRAPCWDR